MYTITHNGATLYDPRLQGYPVDRPKLTREANVFDSLTFTLYPQHPAYGHLDKKSSILNLYRDGTLLCQFVPTYHRRIFNGGIEYKCKNIICFLDDFYFRTIEYNGAASGLITSVLSEYNARVGTAYRIMVGNIHSASVEYKVSDPKTLWEALQEIPANSGGYIAPRFESGNIYLDYLQDADLTLCSQKIQFGENMTDLFIETDTDNCFSVLYPFGTNEDNEVVSIAEANGGVDYLEDATAVQNYGRREKMVTWTNVEDAADLLARAQAKLSEISALFYEGVQLSAVDLHNLNVNIPALEFLRLIDCVSVPHGYTHRYPITKISMPLDAPDSEDITLGMAPKSLTDRITLERKKNAQSRSGGGRAMAKAEKDIIQHWQHVTQVTDRGMSDCFGIIGVSIDPETGLPKVDETTGEYIWMEDDPDASATYGEIWGHLHRDAWTTEILHNVSDSDGNVLSMAQVNVDGHGDILIEAINSQGSGTVKVNANRIDLNGIVTATEFQTAIASLDHVVGDFDVHGSVDVGGTLGAGAINCEGVVECASLDVNGLAVGSVALSNLVNDIGPATASGGQITIPWTRLDGTAGTPINFNIAATQFYLDTLAAFRTALADAEWSGNHATLINATLDTTNKRLTVNSAAVAVQLPGQSSTTQYSIGLGNLDLTTPLTSYYDAAYAAGQAAAPIQPRRYVTYTTNGTRTVTPSSGYDAMAAVEVTVDVPPPAYSASGWGITAAAGGGTKVELYVDGNYFSHTFDNYP